MLLKVTQPPPEHSMHSDNVTSWQINRQTDRQANQHSKPQYGRPQWNIIFLGSKWIFLTVCWGVVGCEWGTTCVYFGIIYACFIPGRLHDFAVGPQYQHRSGDHSATTEACTSPPAWVCMVWRSESSLELSALWHRWMFCPRLWCTSYESPARKVPSIAIARSTRVTSS